MKVILLLDVIIYQSSWYWISQRAAGIMFEFHNLTVFKYETFEHFFNFISELYRQLMLSWLKRVWTGHYTWPGPDIKKTAGPRHNSIFDKEALIGAFV